MKTFNIIGVVALIIVWLYVLANYFIFDNQPTNFEVLTILTMLILFFNKD